MNYSEVTMLSLIHPEPMTDCKVDQEFKSDKRCMNKSISYEGDSTDYKSSTEPQLCPSALSA